jgi:hypothetical protein
MKTNKTNKKNFKAVDNLIATIFDIAREDETRSLLVLNNIIMEKTLNKKLPMKMMSLFKKNKISNENCIIMCEVVKAYVVNIPMIEDYLESKASSAEGDIMYG